MTELAKLKHELASFPKQLDVEALNLGRVFLSLRRSGEFSPENEAFVSSLKSLPNWTAHLERSTGICHKKAGGSDWKYGFITYFQNNWTLHASAILTFLNYNHNLPNQPFNQ